MCQLAWLKQTLASITADWNLHWAVYGSNVFVIWLGLCWIYVHANPLSKGTGLNLSSVFCFCFDMSVSVLGSYLMYAWLHILLHQKYVKNHTKEEYKPICMIVFHWSCNGLFMSYKQKFLKEVQYVRVCSALLLSHSSVPLFLRWLLQQSGPWHDSPLTAMATFTQSNS